MANLIIKSSADDLVLKGSGGSSAITVGATGTTTFAENATLSGTANNLGTVTAGTLSHGTTLQGWADASNDGVTFPVGHVIQTVPKNFYGGSTTVSGTTWTPTYYVFAITPQRNNSKILVNFSVGLTATVSASYSDGGGAVALFRDIGGAGYPAAGSPTKIFNASGIDHYIYNSTTAEVFENNARLHFSFIDSPATESVVTYKIYLRQWALRSNIIAGNWSQECCSVLQEIAQ